jgi:hypothetical protein
MRKILILSALVLVFISMTYGQLLLKEDFDKNSLGAPYVLGAPLDTTDWKNHSGTVPDTIAAGLTYAGYTGSAIGNSVKLAAGGSSDYNRTFTAQTSGNVYTFFLVNVSAATTGGDYFIHYSSNPFNGGTTGIRGRLFAKGNTTADSVSFGLSFGSGNTVYTGMNYKVNTTYLFAFKVNINPGASDDSVSFYVFTSPTLPTSEPKIPTVGPVGDATTNDNIGGVGAIALRQGASNEPTVRVDGIRVMTNWNIATYVEEKSAAHVPSSFALSQNFPNPFNPSTNFTYQIAKEGFVSVKVYDVLGQEAATLVNEYKPAGSYRATWNAATFNSGIYFCRIETGSFTETKKMVLVK